ncbi:hypothetical protein D9615_002410 [Tricholomella constricta]|uniref:RING-type E3 ubiquitin transferase n=1 Tax=Tricholomella constricta TaxID=117010 RepID=A0A8H5M9L9_9AGAR|nr:hypothetical protein D9615_002410 [Tricholomella constricta]
MPLNDVLRHRTNALASSLNSHRILIYSLFSVLAVSAAIANALRNYSNFYSVAISLSKSNRSVLALANFGFLFSLLCGHIVQRIFFGTLRANEVERLYDRLWFFITESLLAFTIFRDEFDIPFALMFGFLLFIKSFHWLAGDRIEWMDQRPYPGPSPLFHLRMMTLFIVLWITDFVMFLITVENTIAHGVGGMVLFASEYGILMASVLNTISKYLLSAYELRRAGRRGGENAPPWENKSMWVFYIELATDFLKLSTYLIFFTIIITFYGLPLNIVRDVYITARSFVTRLRALHRYQTATRNMDERYPNATADDLAAMSDRTCIICREEMVLSEAGQDRAQAPVSADGPNTTPKKLPCGHIFHFHCLRSWLERQQSCPTCRRTVLDPQPQGPDNAAHAAPAAPGEPQRPNLPLPAGAQNQNNARANNPLGNPLGLMGRLFGPPAQLPIVPGQLPPGQNQNNPPPVPENLAGQLPPGVVIQYHIQYQVPRNQQQNQRQQQPQPLQPAPQFAGFPGPGGAWQAWPQDGMAVQEPAPRGTNATPLAPTPTTVGPQSQQVSPSTSVGPTPTPPNRDDDSLPTPREAAALAALRRFHNSNNNSRPSGATTSQSADTQTTGQERPTQALPPPSTSSSTGATAGDRTQASVTGAPPLIPLYDYSASSSAPIFNGETQLLEPHTRIVDGNPRIPPRAIPRPSPRVQHPSQNNSTSLLPPTLTDDQLALMDRLTREAIDERLRVLEGVSSAVYRCVDDLMRMRSTLPSAPMVPTSSVSAANPQRDRNADSPSSSIQLKDSQNASAGPSGLANGEVDFSSGVPGGETEVPEQTTNPSVDHGSGEGDT